MAYNYYGISFGVDKLSGSLYLNMFILSVLEFPGAFLSWFFMNKYVKRISTIFSVLLQVYSFYNSQICCVIISFPGGQFSCMDCGFLLIRGDVISWTRPVLVSEGNLIFYKYFSLTRATHEFHENGATRILMIPKYMFHWCIINKDSEITCIHWTMYCKYDESEYQFNVMCFV